MKIKKGDFVIAWSDETIEIGQAAEDQNEDGEFDLDFFGGGSVSPAGPDAVVVPESVARFLHGATMLLPTDSEGIYRLPEDV